MDNYESAGNIVFTIRGVELPVASVDLSKDTTIEQIRANNVKPIGFSVTEIEYAGSITFEGNGYISNIEVDFSDADINSDSVSHLEDLFTDDEGMPVDGANVTIFHENNNKQTAYYDVMVTSDGYESETSEVSGVSFDVIAGDRKREDVE